jgi:tetratricopeptide (TPR) repeat protein
MKALLFAAIILLVVSCDGGGDIDKTDQQTLRLYANAHALYSDGQFLETAALLDGVKRFPPALTLRAKAHYFSGDLDNAERSFRQTIKFRPGNFEAKLFLVRILRDRGEGDNARQLAENLLADNPHDVRLLRLAAAIAMEQGDHAASSALLDQAAELAADGAMALLDRARYRWTAGRGSEALEDLGRARAMLPWETPAVRSINQLEKRILEAMQ